MKKIGFELGFEQYVEMVKNKNKNEKQRWGGELSKGSEVDSYNASVDLGIPGSIKDRVEGKARQVD